MLQARVTNLSGRGIGLDVVHNTIAQMDGKVSIFTKPDEGFKIVIKNLAMEDMFYTQCIDCTGKNINEGKVVIYTNKIRWEVCGDVERIYFI